MRNILFRILLTVYAFCLTLISLTAFLVFIGLIPFDTVVNVIFSALGDVTSTVVLVIISLIFSTLGIVFLLSGVSADKNRKAIVKFSEVGEIIISINTIENIALAASKKIAGLRDTKARVRKRDDSVSLEIITSVIPDMNIPSVSVEIQEKVKSAVEKTSGITVNDVKVLIENIHTGYKARVE